MQPHKGMGAAMGDPKAAQQNHAGQQQAKLTRIMGICALSFAGMKKKASTITRAAITICMHAAVAWQHIHAAQ